MIFSAAYYDQLPVLRIYQNGRIIWGYGHHTMGALLAVLQGFAAADPAQICSIAMNTAANAVARAFPEDCELMILFARTGAETDSVAAPRTAGAVHGIGITEATIQGTARGSSYGLVFSRGATEAALGESGKPHTVDPVYGTGTAGGGLLVIARHFTDDLLEILAATDIGNIQGWALPQVQETEQLNACTQAFQEGSAYPRAAAVYTVTFMCDGEELCSKTVYEGNNCEDPIIQGNIEAPTKTDSELRYVFSGWTTIEGGDIETAALENVTENRTVYVVYKALPLGTLDNESWETISARSLDGTAEQYYKVGDTKAILLHRSGAWPETILVSIAGFNLHRDSEGIKNGITWIAQWRSSDNLHTAANIDIDSYLLDCLPDDLRDVLQISTIDSYAWVNRAKTYITMTPYLFQPELTNISDALANASGGTELPTLTYFWFTFNCVPYANEYDSEVFPLFAAMSFDQIADFFGLDSAGDCIGTRTLAYGENGSAQLGMCTTVNRDENYTLIKTLAENAPYTFCFRI